MAETCESVKPRVGRPRKGEVREPFDRKGYYEAQKSKFQTYGNLQYYMKKSGMTKDEYEINIKAGLTPDMILKKLKEKLIILKMQKLHESGVRGLPTVGSLP